MVPAPRHAEGDGADLRDLHELYQALCGVNGPPPFMRWKTPAGRDFLLALDNAVSRHQARTVARALGVSTQAVYRMRDLTVPARPRPWPRQEELRALRAAWRPVEAAHGRQNAIPRTSEEFRAVHEALQALLKEGFDLTVIASALRVRRRRLERFLGEPLISPHRLAFGAKRELIE